MLAGGISLYCHMLSNSELGRVLLELELDRDSSQPLYRQIVDGIVANIKSGAKRVPNANGETVRIATLMAIMGRMAMRNPEKNTFEPRVIRWKDLHTTSDPVA